MHTLLSRSATLLFAALVMLLMIGMTTPASAQLLINEPFNYTAHATNGLATQSGGLWNALNSGDSVLVSSGSLSYSGLQASTGNKITFDGSGSDPQRLLSPTQNSGTLYYSFILNVSSIGTLNNTTGGYFTGLAGSSSLFGPVIWTRASGSNYNIGFSPRSSNGVTTWTASSYSTGTNVFVVVALQFNAGANNDSVKMWINPSPASLGGASEPTPDFAVINTATSGDQSLIDRVFIRQDSPTNTPSIEMDEMRIGTSWALVTPQAALQYRSVASGNWSDMSTWESSLDGTTWSAAASTPTSTDGAVTIRTGNVVTVSASVTADEVTVANGGTLAVAASQTLTVNNGTGTDLAVSGTLDLSGSVNGTGSIAVTGGTVEIEEGGWGGNTNPYTYDATSTLVFNNTTATYGVSSDAAYWPNPITNVTVQNTGGITLNAARTVSGTFQTSAQVANGGPGDDLTASGTVQLNAGGYFNGFAPTYSGSATLVYNTGGTYAVGQELGGNSATAAYGVPFNVTIQNGTTVNMPATDRGIGGAINITNGTFALNGTSGNFFLGGNWTRGASGVFTPAGRTVTLNGTATQSVSGSGGETFDNLTVNNSANVTLSSNAAVNGTLTVTAGQLQTGANTVTLGSSATLSEAGNGAIVLGNIADTKTVSAGPTETFGNIGVDMTATGTAPGVTTVTRVTGTALTGVGNQSIKRYYDINAATNTGLNLSVVFHFDTSTTELNGLDENTMNVYSSTTGAAPWTNQAFASRTNTSVTVNGATHLSRWTLSDDAHPLATAASVASDVIAAAHETPLISSLQNAASPLTTGTGVHVWDVVVRDGGASPDGDPNPTVLAGMTVTQGAGNHVPDWSHAILAADLFDGATHLASGVIASGSIAFTGFADTVLDGASNQLQLYISLRNPLGAGVADNQAFDFAVTSANVTAGDAATTSQFASFATASSDSTQNIIDVTATKLGFTNTIPSVAPNANFTATVAAQDANGNTDLAFAGIDTIAIASGPVATLSGTTMPVASNGVATTANLQINNGGVYTLSATSGALTATSNSFSITSPGVFEVAANPGIDTLDWDSPSTWTIVSGTPPTTVPKKTDRVVLNNDYKTGSYVITVGKHAVGDSVATIKIGYPSNPNKITVYVPPTSSLATALFFGDATAGNYDMDIDSNGVLYNSSTRGGSGVFTYSNAVDSIIIHKGGLYYHNSLSFPTFLARLNRATNGDYGTVEFDAPPGATDQNSNGYYFPNLTFSNTHGAGTYFFFGGAGSMVIKGNLTINPAAVESTGASTVPYIVLGNIVNNGSLRFTGARVIMAGTSAQTISGNPVTFGHGLGIANPSGVTVSSDIYVAGDSVITSGGFSYVTFPTTTFYFLTAGGTLDMGANTLYLNPISLVPPIPAGSLVKGAAMFEGSNLVHGKIVATRKDSTGFNESFGNIGYSINAAGTGADTTTVTRTTGTALTGYLGNVSIKRYYDVSAKNGSGVNATVGFAYDPTELNGLTESTLLLHKTTNLGVSWSGQSGTVNTLTHNITAPNVASVNARWTAASTSTPLFIPHTIQLVKLADGDGNVFTSGDQTAKKWRFFLYKDSVSAGTLVGTGNPVSGVLVTSNLEAGTYVAVEDDSTSFGWLTLGTIHHGTTVAGSSRFDTISVSGGVGDTVTFINEKVSTVTLLKFLETDGDHNTVEGAKKWHLSLYKDSVVVANLVAQADTSELFVATPAGTYIAVEADSGASWVRFNGNHTRFDTLIVHSAEAVLDSFINFQPNTIAVYNDQDVDGSFATSADRVAKSWHIEVHTGSVSGPLVQGVDASSLVLTGVGDGTYYVVESDSTGWIRLGYVYNLAPNGGTANNTSFAVAGGQTATVRFVQASPSYAVTYRTVDPTLLAQDKDNKGKAGKIVPAKVDKYFFTVAFVDTADSANGIHIEFSGSIDTVTSGFPYTVDTNRTAVSTDGKLKKWDLTYTSILPKNDTLVVSGYSKSKMKVSKYNFTHNAASITAKPLKGPAVVNVGKLPMPNRINILAASFPTSTGLLVGRAHPDSVKNYGWILAKKYTDVLASLFDKKTGNQSGTPTGFDVDVKSKPILKAQKTLPPSKKNDVLIADMLTLRVNILASALSITPNGLGELIYRDTSSTNPFNGMMVRDIADTGDAYMMGKYVGGVHKFDTTGAFAQLHATIHAIDSAFEGPIDTFSFSGTLSMKGTKQLIQVPFLHANPGVAPAKIVAQGYGVDADEVVPIAYKLYQNYPNPFNPTTNIQFDLPQASTVTLKVYNILGQEVATLFNNSQLNEGTKLVQFNGSNLASGVYFYRLITASTTNSDGEVVGSQFVKVGKMLLVK